MSFRNLKSLLSVGLLAICVAIFAQASAGSFAGGHGERSIHFVSASHTQLPSAGDVQSHRHGHSVHDHSPDGNANVATSYQNRDKPSSTWQLSSTPLTALSIGHVLERPPNRS